jgi:outer membrane murein-binding lipoprotein Lpp
MACILSGCDYWPPALQAQIEQLRTEVQTATAERASMENQLRETMKAKEELQARVGELARLNQELIARATGLEQELAAERAKTAKLGKPSAKAGAKPAQKKTAPKKQPSKTTKKKKKAT